MSDNEFDSNQSFDPDNQLYPPTPENLQESTGGLESTGNEASYESTLESQCGATDDSQPVEQYDGTLGVSQAFIAALQRPVGQLQWDSDLASRYSNPGNVTNVRWCTGALISHNLFITAGHCFDQNPVSWVVPRINGTNDPISSEDIASALHVNFNYQIDPSGNLRTEVEFEIEELVEYRLGGLDIAIVRLAGHPGSLFGIGEMAPTDPVVNDMMAIIGHPAGVPKRIEAGPVSSFENERIRYNSIDTLGGNSGSAIWHEKTRKIVGIHTNGGCNRDGSGSNYGVRVERVRAESPTVRRLDHATFPLAGGIYKVRQESSGRYLDAHHSSDQNYSVVTRSAQSNSTQQWLFKPLGPVCVVRQLSSDRYLDAHQTATNDFSVVTREAQNNDTQQWRLAPLGNGSFTAAQVVNGQFLDAHQSTENDFSAVTRPAQNNNTQRWNFTVVGMVYEIQQVSSGRPMDAHEDENNDFSVVTRTTQVNDTQRWVATYLGGESYTLQQLSTGRFLDAHQSEDNDFSVVTRTAQQNTTQRWIIG